MTRERLPNRRFSLTISVPFEGRRVHVSYSPFPDGRLGELFVGAPKVGSGQHVAALEAFVAASLALQGGIGVDMLLAALPRTVDDRPEGLLGAALSAWVDYAGRVEGGT